VVLLFIKEDIVTLLLYKLNVMHVYLFNYVILFFNNDQVIIYPDNFLQTAASTVEIWDKTVQRKFTYYRPKPSWAYKKKKLHTSTNNSQDFLCICHWLHKWYEIHEISCKHSFAHSQHYIQKNNDCQLLGKNRLAVSRVHKL
jgi:hypothetical protein